MSGTYNDSPAIALSTNTTSPATDASSITIKFVESSLHEHKRKQQVDALPFILWKRLLILFIRFRDELMEHSLSNLEAAKREFASLVGLNGQISCVKYPSEDELLALFGNTEHKLDVMNLPLDVVLTFEHKPLPGVVLQRGKELDVVELLARGRILDRGDAQNCIGLLSDFEARERRPFRVRRHTVIRALEKCTRCKAFAPFGGNPFAEHTKRRPWMCSECRGCFSLVRSATLSTLAFTFGEQHSLRAYAALNQLLDYAVKRGFPEVASTCARALEPLHDPKEKLVNALKARRVGIVVIVLGHIQREALPNMELTEDVFDLLDRAWLMIRDDEASRKLCDEWLRLSSLALSGEADTTGVFALPKTLHNLVSEYLYYPVQPELMLCVRHAVTAFEKKNIT